MNFDSVLTEVCSQESNQQYSIIGSDKGLAPVRPSLLTHICVTRSQWVTNGFEFVLSEYHGFVSQQMAGADGGHYGQIYDARSYSYARRNSTAYVYTGVRGVN